MVTVCLQCGDEGCANALVYCVECLKYAVHRYCLPEVPKTHDEFVYWFCDECEEEASKSGAKKQADTSEECKKIGSTSKLNHGSITDLSAGVEKGHDQNVQGPLFDSRGDADYAGDLRPSRDSFQMENLSNKQLRDSGTSGWLHRVEAVKVAAGNAPQRTTSKKKSDYGASISNKEQQRHSTTSAQFHSLYQNKFGDDGLPRDKFKKDHSSSVAEQKWNGSSSRQSFEAREPMDRAVLEREAKLRKEKQLVIHTRSEVREEVSRDPIAGQPAIATGQHYVPAQPFFDKIWRGSFKIVNTEDNTFEGFGAHLSTKVCKLAYDEARLLPSTLRLELLPKAEMWPKSFEKSQPTDGNIALYFLPAADTRYEGRFYQLVERMNRQELAMKCITRNAELLIFSSTVLPRLNWRFQNKYYLWGVFRNKR